MSKEEPPPRPAETPLDGYLPVGSDAVHPDDPEDEEEDEATEKKRRPVQQVAAPPPPDYPLLSGVYTFPWYSTTAKAWLFSILMGSNAALKQEAVAALEKGGLLAFGLIGSLR